MQDVEAAQAAKEAQSWWAREVAPKIEQARKDLRERARAREAGQAPVELHRWRHVARPAALVWALPGFADLWRQEVPDAAVERTGETTWVTCRCGKRLLLPAETVVFCPCERRWFLALADGGVRVKVWPEPGA